MLRAMIFAAMLIAGPAQATEWRMDSDGDLIGDNGGEYVIDIGCGNFAVFSIRKAKLQGFPSDVQMEVVVDGDVLMDRTVMGYRNGAMQGTGGKDDAPLQAIFQRIAAGSGEMMVSWRGEIGGARVYNSEYYTLTGATGPIREVFSKCPGPREKLGW